jgi:hypothetical protein
MYLLVLSLSPGGIFKTQTVIHRNAAVGSGLHNETLGMPNVDCADPTLPRIT